MHRAQFSPPCVLHGLSAPVQRERAGYFRAALVHVAGQWRSGPIGCLSCLKEPTPAALPRVNSRPWGVRTCERRRPGLSISSGFQRPPCGREPVLLVKLLRENQNKTHFPWNFFFFLTFQQKNQKLKYLVPHGSCSLVTSCALLQAP